MRLPRLARHYAALAYRAYSRIGAGWQLGIFLLLCLLFIWGAVVVNLLHLQSNAEKQAQRNIHNLAQAFAEEVNSSVNTIDLSLIVLRSSWARGRTDYRTVVERLQQRLEGNIIFQIGITDAQGRLIFSSVDPDAKPMDLSDREHIKVHMQGMGDKLFISAPVLGRVSQKWSIQFTRPLHTPTGQFDGVIVASVSPSYFSRFYRQIDLGEGAAIALVRAGGTIIARSPKQIEGKGMGLTLPDPQYQKGYAQSTGSYRRVSRVDGIERLYAWREVRPDELFVVVGQSAADAFAEYESQRRIYLLSGAAASAVLAILGLITLHTARQRSKAVDALAESEARWKFALEGSDEGVWDWDVPGNAVTLSWRGRDILRLNSDAPCTTVQTLLHRMHREDIRAVRAALQSHFDDETPAFDIEYRTRAQGHGYEWVHARGMVVKRAKNKAPLRLVGTVRNINERKNREEVVKHLAQYDPLTDLPNRALFADRLQQTLLNAQRDSTQFAVIYFDLDKFKPVNDTHGHAVGDLLLQAVAARVRDCLRKSDTVARLGGDEFAVLVPSLTDAPAAASAVAASILAGLNTPFDIQGLVLHISGSLGIAIYPADGQDEATLLRCADEAMYQAKVQGRGRFMQYGQRD